MDVPWRFLILCLINSPIITAVSTQEILIVSEGDPVEMERNDEDAFKMAITEDSSFLFENVTDLEFSEEMFRKPPCKVMRFSRQEYELRGDGLVVPALNESFSNFTLVNDDRAEICYPFTTNFRTCTTWGMFQEEYKILPNYKLYVTPYQREFDVGEYFLSEDSEKIAFVCGLSDEDNQNAETTFGEIYTRYFYPTFWIVSCIFLILTAIIIYSSKSKLNIASKVQLHHIISITIAYSFLVIHRFATQSISLSGICVVLAVNIHWWFLAAFTWLNVLAFHTWFNVVDRDSATSKKAQSTRFTMYSVYAWLTPALITMVTLVLDQFLSEEDSAFRPRFANACWFNNTNSLVAFFYGPLALFILINIIFFILTVSRVQRMAQATMANDKKGQAKLILVYVRLQVIMGLWWILEVISWAFSDYKNLTYVLDTVTSLQGIFIFIAYQCHHNLWYYIKHGTCIPAAATDDDFTESRNSQLSEDNNYTNNIKDSFVVANIQEKEKSSVFA